MASSSGKMNQPPGGSGACNGTAIADIPNVNVEQELYDYQMHTKMCKKIAQLTKVIYSLNTKNEEQEATLQSLRRVATETQGSLQPTTGQDEEEEESASILRTRLLELQATVEEVEERGQRAEIEYVERIAVLTQETSDLRRDFQNLQTDRDNQHKLLQQTQEENKRLENECQELRRARDEERKKEEEEKMHRVEEERKREMEERNRESQERQRVEEECEERLKMVRKELQALREEKERAEKEWKRDVEEWKKRVKEMEEERREEQKATEKTLQKSLNEHINQWHQREQENRKSQNATLQQRLRKAETDLEVQEQRLNESNRHCNKLQERVEDLEEQLEDGRHRVTEAEAVAKKAEEELAVAKERLLLQENELQKELMSQSSSQVRVSAEVEELRFQLSRLNIRNKELELQNSGRSNDHARMLKQHADTLSSMRLELQRAHTEEIRRLQQEVESERKNDRQELEEEKKQVQQKMEEEKVRLKEQLRKALEEVIRKHASELRQAHAMLDAEKKKTQQIEEQMNTGEEERKALETEREELRNQLQLSNREMAKLEGVIQTLEKEREEEKERAKEREQEYAKVERQSACGPECVRVREELENTHSSMQQIQEECAAQKEVLQAEISALQQERDILQQSNHGIEERIRLQFEKQFSDQIVEMKREREEEIRKMNQQWQHRVEELQTQLEERRALSEKMEGERERRYGNGEMERMKQEIQKTRDMNSTLRSQLHSTIQEKERLMRQQLQVVKEEDEDEEDGKATGEREEEREKRGWREREEELLRVERLNHQRALQALEAQANEELQSERQRLLTQHKLQLDKQKAELTQQHTEWVRQVTQRHMQQIEDLQNEIHTYTQMMALQQDLKQQNRLQSLERQLDEKSSEVQELKRENEDLKERMSAVIAQKEERDDHKNKHKSFSEERDEAGEAVGSDHRNNMESVKREHRMEIQTIISDFSTAQTRLQARIVALETELREREERGKRRVEDLHTIAKLQDKLSERDQLIKSLVEDLHQLSQHPTLCSNEILKPYDSRTQAGTLTPTMKKKGVEETSIPNLCSYDGGSPKAKCSPVMERGLSSLEQCGRGTTLTRTHTPTSPHSEHRASIRQSRPPSQEVRHQPQLKINYNQHIRTPAEQRVIETGPDGQDPQKQEWFTKYFSF
ncbi:protein FAM184B isoform X2 [Onychostoma macrolepis]|uniref:protein FAM184B isoform X2 n=1 Tax=Onychostoma macrolepis TaxID=369639 RepID=UPI00272D88CE|nr:protein FAM184B isoform X2 [Onychostoma macrolepis]